MFVSSRLSFRTSDGYNTIGWKFFVGQAYAIPIFIIAAIITFYINKKRSYE
ncbi:DUF4017 family protein [Bacillus sp. TH23]|nr:DUF4017 family protein [Bacillus sp. TH23]